MRLKRLNKLSAFSFNLPNCEHVSSMPRSSSKVIDCFRWILAHTKVCLKMPFKCEDAFGDFVMCVNNTRTIQTILPKTPFDWSVYSNVLPNTTIHRVWNFVNFTFEDVLHREKVPSRTQNASKWVWEDLTELKFWTKQQMPVSQKKNPYTIWCI